MSSGTVLVEPSDQATFHDLGSIAHTIGLSRLHHLVGNPGGIVGDLTPDLEAALAKGRKVLCEALPQYADTITAALEEYVRLAEDVPHQKECTETAQQLQHVDDRGQEGPVRTRGSPAKFGLP